MSNLKSQVAKYIKKEKLCLPESKLLLTVSGGVDSIVLAHVLHELGYYCEIAHCNFQLRGQESDNDEQLASSAAKKLSAPFHSKKFETSIFAKEQGVSTQMAARDLRYEWFEQLRKSFALNYIVTAHHSNDQAETILFNWVKGTGIKGMRGMLPKAKRIIRPLLFASKQDLVLYAVSRDLIWREDESNSSNKYHRNLIRNVVIPQLGSINPGIENTVSNNIDRARSLEELLDFEVKLIKKNHLIKLPHGYELRLNWLKGKEGRLVLLEQLLGKFGFNLSQVKSILESIDNRSGKRFHSSDHVIILDRDRLFIEVHSDQYHQCTIDENTTEFDLLGQHFTVEFQMSPLSIIKDSSYAMLDADLLTFPLKARNWQIGDRFVPLGMKHQKKVSDFMIDIKIPLNLKKRTVIFESADDIVWIAGHRISDKYKVTKKTTRCLLIKQD